MTVLNVVRSAIWYHLHNLKNVKNTHGGVLILVILLQSHAPRSTSALTLLLLDRTILYIVLKPYHETKKTICMTQRNYNSTNKISNFLVTMNVTTTDSFSC